MGTRNELCILVDRNCVCCNINQDSLFSQHLYLNFVWIEMDFGFVGINHTSLYTLCVFIATSQVLLPALNSLIQFCPFPGLWPWVCLLLKISNWYNYSTLHVLSKSDSTNYPPWFKKKTKLLSSNVLIFFIKVPDFVNYIYIHVESKRIKIYSKRLLLVLAHVQYIWMQLNSSCVQYTGFQINISCLFLQVRNIITCLL